MKTVREVRDWAFAEHAKINHRYDSYPYSYHLQMVANAADLFYVPQDKYNIVQMACYCHDILEDTRNTYNDLKAVVGEEVAEIVYALTNEKGRNRKERANDKYYEGIRNTPFAVFVKACDRIANMQFSKKQGSRMYAMYKRELEPFIEELDLDFRYPEMAKHLRKI